MLLAQHKTVISLSESVNQLKIQIFFSEFGKTRAKRPSNIRLHLSSGQKHDSNGINGSDGSCMCL